MRKLLLSCAAALALVAPEVSAAGRAESGYIAGMVVGTPKVVPAGEKAAVSVDLLARGRRETLATEAMDAARAAAVSAGLAPGVLVDFRMAGDAVLVPADAAEPFRAVLSKDSVWDVKPDPKASYTLTMQKVVKPGSGQTQFDAMKYGPELRPWKGAPGAMVAAGWVYGKTDRTITVGDGRLVAEDIAGRPLPKARKRYEETYEVAKNAVVYKVDTADYGKSAVSDFASIPVTANYDYATTARQAVYVVFDRNYLKAEKAKAVAIYYFTPQAVSDGKPVWDVQTRSSLLKARGADPVSGKPFVSINATGAMDAPYSRSTEPFEIVKNAFYYIGDNEVAIYLFKADMGTPDAADDRLIMLDAGWPNSGYQYWKNIEAMGCDPRKITDLMLTHGHLDHYGVAMELVAMIENSGGSVKVWGTKEDTLGISADALGNQWSIKGALPENETELRKRTVFYEYDKEMDFGNVKILVTPTPGHTPGTGSFIFKVKQPGTGNWLSFGYMGGYGFNGLYTPNPSNGFLRLSFQLGLAWLQQMVDVDYVAPQHTNQYPLVDIYQAVAASNNDPANAAKHLSLMDALTKNEFVNFCEKRYSVVTNSASDLNDSRYKSVETSGPFKPGREYGASGVKAKLLDGGKIIRGFNGVFNVNPAVPLLKEGILNNTDVYTKDPDGYYVQFYIDVLDGYQGFIPGSGPVESMRPTPGAPEILRTQRLNSREEAETILKSVKKGETYKISLTAASAIIVPGTITDTFKPLE